MNSANKTQKLKYGIVVFLAGDLTIQLHTNKRNVITSVKNIDRNILPLGCVANPA